MEFRLLGSVEVLRDGRPIALAGAKQRALLVLLLLHANELVSRDVLLDQLWADQPSVASSHSLDVQISRLRKALGSPELIATRGSGYVLVVEPDWIDAVRFERLLAAARAENAAHNFARAARWPDRASRSGAAMPSPTWRMRSSLDGGSNHSKS